MSKSNQYILNQSFTKKLLDLFKKNNLKMLVQYLYQYLLSKFFLLVSHDGVSVMEEPWDYLIVLTSCRYDFFKMLNKIPGRLEKRISKGSCTIEWIIKNFTGYYDDVVYVSANPYISHVAFRGFRGSDHFYKVINVWDHGWDKELNTVPPHAVTQAALQAKERYPDKRLIVHYIQPHAPWIGKIRISGKELGISYDSPIDWYNRNMKIGLGLWGIWEIVIDKGIGLNLIKKAYVENLKLVLSEVEKLVKELDGRIIVTSDHGECLGEHFLVEHPEGIYVKELVEVPWLIIEKPKREKSNLKWKTRI